MSTEVTARKTSLISREFISFDYADPASASIVAGAALEAGGPSRGILVTLQYPTAKLQDANGVESTAFDLNQNTLSITVGSTRYLSEDATFVLDYCPGAAGFDASSPTPPPTCPYMMSNYTCTMGEFLFIDDVNFSLYGCRACEAGYYQDEDEHTYQSCKIHNAALCPSGQYLVSDRNLQQDRKCSPCETDRVPNADASQYMPSSGHANAQCLNVAGCATGHYESVVPNAATNRVCSVCPAGKYQSQNGYTGDVCDQCPTGEYSSAAASACVAHTTCADTNLTTQFVATYGTSISDTICDSCQAGEHYLQQDISTINAFVSMGDNTNCRGPSYSFDNFTAFENYTSWPKTVTYGSRSDAEGTTVGIDGCSATCTLDVRCTAYQLTDVSGTNSTECYLYGHTTVQAESTTQSSTCYRRSDLARSCAECPSGEFQSSTEHISTSCELITPCGLGQMSSSEPWPSADRQCSDCPADKYMDETSHTNKVCKNPFDCSTLGLSTATEATRTSDTICEAAPAASTSLADDSTGTATSISLAVVAILSVVILMELYKLNKKNNTPLNFGEELGKVEEEFPDLQTEITKTDGGLRVPREIKDRDITLDIMLGHGAFGEVYKGVLSENLDKALPYIIAVKTLKTEDEDAKKEFLLEATLMTQLHHPNVSGIIGISTVNPPMKCCLQFMENGELLKFLQKHSGFRVLTEGALLQVAYDVACGMEYLHGLRIMHRDLAARNVLVDALYVCQIADFGLSRAIPKGRQYLTIPGKFPARWTALEAYNHKYSLESDIWAYGVLCYEIYTSGAKPYLGKTNDEAMTAVKAGFRLSCPMDCKQETFDDIIMPCWQKDPSNRPQFTELKDLLAEALKVATGELKQKFGKQRLASMKRVNIKKRPIKAKADPTRSDFDENEYVMAADTDDEDGGEADYTMGDGLDGAMDYNDDVAENLYTDAAGDDVDDDDVSAADYAMGNGTDGASFFDIAGFDENNYAAAADSQDEGVDDYTNAAY